MTPLLPCVFPPFTWLKRCLSLRFHCICVVPLPSRLRHGLCLVCDSTAAAAKTSRRSPCRFRPRRATRPSFLSGRSAAASLRSLIELKRRHVGRGDRVDHLCGAAAFPVHRRQPFILPMFVRPSSSPTATVAPTISAIAVPPSCTCP